MDLFVYGTLQSKALMQAVAGGVVTDIIPAQLMGYRVQAVRGDVVPFICPSINDDADGQVYVALTDAQMVRLDAYEGAFGYQLTPVMVQTDAGLREAYCYIPPSDVVAETTAWSFDVWQSTHEAPAALAATELFSHDPLPDHASLRRMWPMMEARAWSKHRAAAAPSTVRYTPRDGDLRVLQQRPPSGGFFRLQNMDVSHRQFDGAMTTALTREVFVGVDAAILLPYDPARDRVLLVEQTRMGPVVRQDPNPWMLEPVAGIVDARETPEAAAHREALEEAGVALHHLERAGSYYPSPGGSTDYFYNFVGLCDLPMTTSYLGGLDAEAEDLRLHPIGFEEALALTDTGEIQTGPLIYLLHWLLRHRDRFRDGV